MKSKIKKIIIKTILPRGYSEYFSGYIIKKFKDDFLYNKNTTLKEKLWCYKKGFLSDKIDLYNLNDNNFRLYMDDFNYYKLHPINGKYSKLIDDKLTTMYILQPFNKYLPKHYFQIEKNKIMSLMDKPKELANDIQSILELLKKEKDLSLKLVSSTYGNGFYKLSYNGNKFYVNEKEMNVIDLKKFIENLDGYIVTEYLYTHSDLRRIYSKTANTLRIMTIYDDEQGPLITRAFIRFGNSKSGFVENIMAGGVFAKIDISTGRFFDASIPKNYSVEKCHKHPDTGEKIEGYLPYWNEIKEKIIEICNYIPQIRYMGWDIVITDTGFKILEINSHQGIGYLQSQEPLFKNKNNKKFFNELLEKNN